MLKKTMTYLDFDGEQRTEDFYFNLTKAEVADLELAYDGGLTKVIEKISQEKNNKVLWEIFKDIVLKSYGEKSLDGKRFVKIDKDGHKLCYDFAQTQAFSDLVMELSTKADAAAKFFNAIIPEVK